MTQRPCSARETEKLNARFGRSEETVNSEIQIGGGVGTIRQYLEAGLIDELHVAIAPRVLGSGEHLLHGLDLPALGYACTTHVPTAAATHVVLAKRQ